MPVVHDSSAAVAHLLAALDTRAITPETQRVAANVTGANRLLIGVGWSVVILIYWFKHRDILDLRGKLGPEVTFLAAATLLTFAIFFLKGIHVLLAAVLIGVYLAYLWVGSTRQAEEPELAGTTRWLGSPADRMARWSCSCSCTPPASSWWPPDPS